MVDVHVSIVVPLYRSTDSADALLDAISRTAERASLKVDLVLIDDACPARSAEVFATLPCRDRISIRAFRHSRNVGQFRAIQTGLTFATAPVVAVMDADLQDDPDSLIALIRQLDGDPTTVVAAGRRGQYEPAPRRFTARAFRGARFLLSRGRIPADAGLNCVMTKHSVDRILAIADPGEHLLTSAARAGIRIVTIPTVRRSRSAGTSAYSGHLRWSAALAALLPLTPFRSLAPGLRDDAPLQTVTVPGSPTAPHGGSHA